MKYGYVKTKNWVRIHLRHMGHLILYMHNAKFTIKMTFEPL